MKITYLDAATMGDSSLAPIEALGELTCWPNSTAEEALMRVHDCEVLIVNKVTVTRELLDAAMSLKLVCAIGCSGDFYAYPVIAWKRAVF